MASLASTLEKLTRGNKRAEKIRRYIVVESIYQVQCLFLLFCVDLCCLFSCPYGSLEHKMSIQPVQPRQFMKPLLKSSWFVTTEFWPNCPLGWDCQVEGEISVPCYSGGESFFWGAWQVWARPCWTLWSSCEYFASAFLNVSPWFGNGVKEKNKRYIAQFSGQSPIGS
jgi:serine palmitoyltransferase